MRSLKPLLSFCAAASLGLALVTAAAPVQAQQDSIQARLAAYKERVARLEDQAEIENLQAIFGYYFDKGLWSDAASLFSQNGSFEYGQRGVYIGPKRIEHAMLLFGPQGLAKGYLNNHMMLQNVTIVAPDGKTATGRWQGPVQLASPGANGKWGVGIYEDEYVKEGGVWKFSKVHFYMTAETDYDKPWTTGAIPMEGQSALFPPDKPPTEVYRSFPGAYIPPFSYDHPVTGKSLKDIPEPPDTVLGRP